MTKISILLIRHGKTYGNSLHRYIGATDEPLLTESEVQLKELAGAYPKIDALYVSPLMRCRQTANCLFPDMEQKIVPDLRETDFGSFENKNYRELSGDPHYQAWIDSGGTMAFPGGEDPKEVSARVKNAFTECIRGIIGKAILSRDTDAFAGAGRSSNEAEEQTECSGFTIAFVVHGGTIMSILEAFGDPKADYYSWHAENAEGYLCTLDTELFTLNNEVRLYEIQHAGPDSGLHT